MKSGKPYWERLEFSEEAISIVKCALRTKLWRGTWPEQTAKLSALNFLMSVHYGVREVPVILEPRVTSPFYDGACIVLTKPSLVSWAHEFGHHLLHEEGKRQNEEFPRAFSLGLFYRAAPKLFDAARKRGKLLFTEVL